VATVELTKENFEDVVASGGIVLVDFWASWCGPCRQFAPIYEQASEENPDIVFGSIDTESQPELSGAFNVSSIPTLMIVRDSVVLFQQAGALPPQALADLIDQTRALDMDKIRREAGVQE
jgi:thioredoxin 1